MKDLAPKKFLRSQPDKSRLPYLVGAIGLTALLSICGNRVLKANREENEFMKSLYAAPKIEHVTKEGDTLNKLCSNQGLDMNQKESCKDYLIKVYPELNKNMPIGKIIYIPDIKNMSDR